MTGPHVVYYAINGKNMNKINLKYLMYWCFPIDITDKLSYVLLYTPIRLIGYPLYVQ